MKRRVFIYYLENYPDQQAALEAIEYLKDITSKGAATYTEKTSSLKLKKISSSPLNKSKSSFLFGRKKSPF